MTDNPSPSVDLVLDALSDSTRRSVVELLGSGPRRAGDLAGVVGTSAPTMSRHLRVLLEAGIVVDERPRGDARTRVFRLQADGLVALQSWLDQIQAHWDEQLGSFQCHVEQQQKKRKKK